MLLKWIDKKGYTDAECYKRAGLDRRVFSKIRSNPDYQPKKTTVLALAIGLKLSVHEAKKLLERAGYGFSSASRQDLIVQFFLEKEIYDIIKINEVLYKYGQSLLGSV